MTAPLLALLELTRPDLTPAERLAIVADTPDARRQFGEQQSTQKPAHARVGSRPRTAASMERRRSWAAAGLLPPRLAARFTLAEVAVLAVVAQEILHAGVKSLGGTAQIAACTLTLDHIAALAGVCRTTVRNALREAARLGFIRVEERRLSAWRNAPNKVTITSPEWSSWLKLRRKGGGVKSVPTTNTSLRKQAESRFVMNTAKGFQKEGAGIHELFRSQTSPPARPQVSRGAGLSPRTRNTG